MCDIIDLKLQQPHMNIVVDDEVLTFPVAMIRKIASGQESVAEYENPELIARAWAIALIERL